MRRSRGYLHSAFRSAVLFAGTAAVLVSCADRIPPADLVLVNGDFTTMEPSAPSARALAVTGDAITAVCASDREAERYIGPATKVVDLGGGWAVPGIIDGHVHFNQAGALILDANLMTVSDEAGLRAEIARVVGILDDGEWITGGLYGAYERWALGDAGEKSGGKKSPWRPHRAMIDDLTAANPCLLCRFDYKEWLANTAALETAGLGSARVEGLEVGKDGKPTGIVFAGTPAFKKLRDSQKPKSRARLLEENRAALKALREAGVVEVHDIERPDQTDRFVELEAGGELTCRVWLRPDLSRCEELGKAGFTMGLHPKTKERSAWLRYGALKGYIDGIMGTHGALFFEPYDDEPGNSGHWRPHTSDDPELRVRNMDKMYGLVRKGLEYGFVPNVHAIGDRGVAEMLDLYERLQAEGVHLDGFRVIHAQVIRPGDFPRFKALGVVAEVNPYHISDDMRWMEERIGRERCKGAYAFRDAPRERRDPELRLRLAGDERRPLPHAPEVPHLRRGHPADADGRARGRLVPGGEDLGRGGPARLHDRERPGRLRGRPPRLAQGRQARRRHRFRPEHDDDPAGRHPQDRGDAHDRRREGRFREGLKGGRTGAARAQRFLGLAR